MRVHLISFSPFFSSLPLLSSRDSSILSPCTLQSPLPSTRSLPFPFSLYFTSLYFTGLAFTKFNKISTFLFFSLSLPRQISISSRLFFPRRQIFRLFFYPRFSTQIARGNATIVDHGREILYPRKGDRIISDRKRGRNIVRESDSERVILNYDV